MSTEYRFVHPVDTLSIRSNKLFGDAGSHSESQFPPRPSVLSGAFRSILWLHNGGDLNAILNSTFAITGLLPARKNAQGNIETFLPAPADLVITDDGNKISRLQPQPIDSAVQHSQLPQLPMLPLLRQSKQAKPTSGWLLTQSGIQAYIQGEKINKPHLIHQECLWAKELRIGISLNAASRTAEKGKLFSVEHSVLTQTENGGMTAGLVVGIEGSEGKLPQQGFIRLGGDGRAAQFAQSPTPQSFTLPKTDKFKLILQTPGLFKSGWLPTFIEKHDDHYWLQLNGLKARLACASISRAETISGWDLATWQPKLAERVVPTGSVYWFDQVQGSLDVLNKLANHGWWPDLLDDATTSRRAEGYNRILLAAW